MVSICTLRVRLFLKSFSPKPACLVATENKIFRISSSCWPKFTPLTRKWIYTLIFTSIHFWKKGEREREREREPRSESTDRWAARSFDEHARRLTSGAIDERCDHPTSTLVDRDRWSSSLVAIDCDWRRDRTARRSTSDAIAPLIAISTIAVLSRRPSSGFVWFVFSFFFSKHQKIFFRNFFEM